MLARIRSRLANRDNAGFTLIELIIVVVILGILTAIAIPSYGGIQDKARFSTNQENLQTSVKLIEAYKAKHGEYPKTGDKGGWLYQRNDANGPDRNKYIPGLVPEFINELPMPSNKETQFVYNSDGNDYKLMVYSNTGFKDSEWKQVPSSMKDTWGAAYLDRYGYWSEGFAGV